MVVRYMVTINQITLYHDTTTLLHVGLQARDQQNNTPLLGRPLQVDFAQLDDKFSQSLAKTTVAPPTAMKRKEPAPASVAVAAPEMTNKRVKKNTTPTETSEISIDAVAESSSTVRLYLFIFSLCVSRQHLETIFAVMLAPLSRRPCKSVAHNISVSLTTFSHCFGYVCFAVFMFSQLLPALMDCRGRWFVPRPSAKSK